MSENTHDIDVEIHASDPDFQVIFVSLAESVGLHVIRPPRSRSTLLVRCPEEQAAALLEQADRVAICLFRKKLELLSVLLGARGAALPARLRRHVAELNTRIAADPKLAELDAQVAKIARRDIPGEQSRGLTTNGAT